ncbi:hypothetical protein FHS95_000039 [Sphingomonas naasensis]|uniref:Uncharacterized protein n=1 Tax=Sphingomonas naasensis TaxID=1344951 RepID=A0A4S1WQL2_9SPHN|nr:hypothetical protein [Sphingomonas naasensis]NIJ18370.1 hypothetical protein [Sphingomonas naasensis]TGX45639.1 hypothetical protein E5A74_00195 [Sphingomonas naasensis]
MLATIGFAPAQTIPAELVGKYSDSIAEQVTGGAHKPKCDRPGWRYLQISDKGIDWGDGVLQSLISVERISTTKFHLWIKRPASNDVRLLHVFIDRDYGNSIVIVDEIAQTETQARAPGTADAGVLGTYLPCAK